MPNSASSLDLGQAHLGGGVNQTTLCLQLVTLSPGPSCPVSTTAKLFDILVPWCFTAPQTELGGRPTEHQIPWHRSLQMNFWPPVGPPFSAFQAYAVVPLRDIAVVRQEGRAEVRL